jgi:hypothetical protein
MVRHGIEDLTAVGQITLNGVNAFDSVGQRYEIAIEYFVASLKLVLFDVSSIYLSHPSFTTRFPMLQHAFRGVKVSPKNDQKIKAITRDCSRSLGTPACRPPVSKSE